MRLSILHTNDLHGHLENWSVIDQYLTSMRRSLSERGIVSLIVDIGDACDASHPLVEVTNGQIMTDLFNKTAYDYVTIGNNEGLGFSKAQLYDIYANANHQVCLANLLDNESNSLPEWAKEVRYHIFENGLKIALIGLTAQYESYRLNGYIPLDPMVELENVLDTMDSDCDLVVLLSHCGIRFDQNVAKCFPKIDIVIGAHTHHLFAEGKLINHTMLAAAGKYGYYVGKIDVDFNPVKGIHSQSEDYVDGKVICCSILSIEELKDMTVTDQEWIDFSEVGKEQLLSQKVANLPHPLKVQDDRVENSFVEQGLMALLEEYPSDIALLNTGLFLKDLPSGIISLNDLHEALPHPMHLITFDLSGSQLLELINQIESQRDKLKNKQIIGMGFRGTVFGEIIYNGLSYDSQLNKWQVGNEDIDINKMYHLVSVDHLCFIPFFSIIEKEGTPLLHFPDFLRHSLANYLKKHYPVR